MKRKGYMNRLRNIVTFSSTKTSESTDCVVSIEVGDFVASKDVENNKHVKDTFTNATFWYYNF